MKKYYCVMQDDKKDCGVSCLLSIIRYYGGDASKEYLRDITNTTKDGTDAYSLMQGAKELGFSTKGVKGDVFELEDSMFPCICHVILKNSYQHFCVLNRIDRKNKILFLSDPAQGMVRIKYNNFQKISTNQFLLFLPNKEIPIFEKKSKVYQILFSELYHSKTKLFFVFLTSIFYTILNIILAFYFQFLVETGITNQFVENIQKITLLFLFFTLVKEFMNFFRAELFQELNCKLDHALMCNIVNHILSLPYLYYRNRTTGEIISRINNLSEIREFLSELLLTFFIDIFLFIFVFITLISISFKLSILFLFFLFLYSILSVFFDSYIISYLKKAKQKIIERTSYLYEMISSGFTMKGLHIKNDVYHRFLGKYNESLNTIYKWNHKSNGLTTLKNLCEQLFTMALLYVGSILVIKEELTLGNLITYHGLIFYFFNSIKGILNIPILCKKMKIEIDRIDDLYKIKEDEILCGRKMKPLEGSIKIQKLSFSYGSKELLKNVSFSVSPGEKVVLSGSSGTGKSTLAKLIMGYMKVNRNMILLDQKDINDLPLEEIQSQIAYVSQDEYLFTDSIYNNITIGEKNVMMENFLKICEMTKVDEIIQRNVLGYNMLLEENGSNISGGEKERIVLARALLKQRQIYILDEALSQVDIETERKILKKIFKEYKNKTFIFISHRFDNNDLFDRQIVLGG